MRRTGVLLHPSSLPSEYGIGDLGPAAYRFADYLHKEGFSLWQMLPLNHCGYGNSPYNPVSAFALNPYLISPEMLYEHGLINKSDLLDAVLPASGSVFYESVYKTKDRLLVKAADNWLINDENYAQFIERKPFLKPYLAFQVLSRIYDDHAWYRWNGEHNHYSDQLFDRLWQRYGQEMKRCLAYQGMLAQQITSLKSYLHDLNIKLVGDLPLYLSYESAEVWACRQLFDLDEHGNRNNLAGVPPDAFSPTGQLWGNPIYRWDKLNETGYELFINRIGQALEIYDYLRLDHFIGYVNYWQVEGGISSEGTINLPETAINGAWVPARPNEFFRTLLEHFPKEKFIAEDLGILNPDVCHIRDDFGFPGMIVLQFCFEESVPQVAHYPTNRWLYTGTHDNSTTRGWFEGLSHDDPSYHHLHDYCAQFRHQQCQDYIIPESISRLMCKIALSSGCDTVIFPVQDILGLDDSARMNTPGTALGNWQWRMTNEDWQNLTGFCL